MINVTKAFLPPIEEYEKYLKGIWERAWLTNHGPLVKDLENQLKNHLAVKNFQYTSNGTIAIQLAIKALDLKGEIITTPFSYVATTTALLWENCTPIFVDIENKSFCIDPEKIENAITPNTSAILATHVYGYPCNVEAIEKIAKKYHLKIIYDGAHAFGVKIGKKSIFEFGDISTLSLHATKLFHSVEGGAVICNNEEIDRKISLLKSFGHEADSYYTIGINGKNSEFHAAMGLCNLKYIEDIIEKRKKISEYYDQQLKTLPLERPIQPLNTTYNYAYYPVIFENEDALLNTKQHLEKNQINTRRYFYPSLNKLPYVAYQPCPVAENISTKILCLPLYPDLKIEEIDTIVKNIKEII